MNKQSSCVIWRFVDGKRGHENQTRGLVNALIDIATAGLTIKVQDYMPLSAWRAWISLLTGNYPGISPETPRPDLIIGAGHRVHFSMLAARRCTGAPVVVMMKPGFPLRWFDLAIVPEHDDPGSAPNCIQTRGVLNTVKPSGAKQANRGLILVGGPSKHHGWDSDALVEQVTRIVSSSDIDWILSNSRRTPAGFLATLAQAGLPRLELVEAESTDVDWLPAQLEKSATVWVSEDSVSMVYEALTSGAACGLLEMPLKQKGRQSGKQPGRVQRGVDRLVESGWVTRFTQWQETGKTLKQPAQPLYEAGRVASKVLGLCQAKN